MQETNGTYRVTTEELKRDLSKLLDSLQASRKPIVVTRHGQEVAQLVPCSARDPFDADPKLAPLEIAEDAFAPIGAEDWAEELR